MNFRRGNQKKIHNEALQFRSYLEMDRNTTGNIVRIKTTPVCFFIVMSNHEWIIFPLPLFLSNKWEVIHINLQNKLHQYHLMAQMK